MAKKLEAGDQGQRYVVHAHFQGKDMRVGWQDEVTGGIIPTLQANLACTRVWLIDREADENAEPAYEWNRKAVDSRKKARDRRRNKREGKGKRS